MPEKFLHAEFLITPSVQFFNGRLQEKRNCTETKKYCSKKFIKGRENGQRWQSLLVILRYVYILHFVSYDSTN